MAITPVQGNSSYVKADGVDATKSSTKKEEVKAQPQPPKKADSATISEKAKDLAALKSGTQFTEEAKESITARNQEAMQNSFT